MCLVLDTKYTKERLGNSCVINFYKARYFRLLPTYWLGCILVILLSLLSQRSPQFEIWAYLRSLSDSPGNLVFKTFLCFTNTTMIFQDLTMFTASHNREIQWSADFWKSDMPLWQGLLIPQAWSLGIEISFYLIAPFLLRLRSTLIALLAIAGLSTKILLVLTLHLNDPWTYRFFPFELGYFLLGVLAFRNRTKLERIISQKSWQAHHLKPIIYCAVSLVSGYKLNRFNWLELSRRFSWESEGWRACRMGVFSKSVTLKICRIW